MKKGWYLALAVLILLLDQWTKSWAQTSLLPYQPMPILPFLNLTLAYNTGAAFSFLSGAGVWVRWFFPLLSLTLSLLLLVWLWKTPNGQRLQLTAIALLLGGASGNLIDRALEGRVVDFIDVFYQNYHWPIFNVADSAICIGAFLLAIELARKK